MKATRVLVVCVVCLVFATLVVLAKPSNRTHKKFAEERAELLQAAGLSGKHTFDCNDGTANGVTVKLMNHGICDVTLETYDTTLNQAGHDEVGLLYAPQSQVADVLHLNHVKGKKFKVIVLHNPDDVPNPPPGLKQGDCLDWPFESKVDDGLNSHHDPGSVKMKKDGTTNPCYYKLSFEFEDGTKIDPHISVGK